MKRVKRIAVLGAECTGKSWLTHALTQVLQMRGHTVTSGHDVLASLNERHDHGVWPIEPPVRGVHAPTRTIENTSQRWLISDTPPIMAAAACDSAVRQNPDLCSIALAHAAQFDTTLLMGLDGPRVDNGLTSQSPLFRGQVDTRLRQALHQAGIAYQVVYGQGQQRLNNALLALGLPGEDLEAQALREQSQFAINQGRTVWQCNECSDPDCEHKLFTGLLAKRQDSQSSRRKSKPFQGQ